MPNTKTYHHGNLKEALVEAYLDLLGSTSPEDISLRKLAAQLGVAPTAVYNHFADKDALTCAARARCLRHFSEFLNQQYQASASPEANLLNLAKRYFRYSIEHSEMFKIIFQQPGDEQNVTEELIEAGMQAEEKLQQCVCALLQQESIPLSQYNQGLAAFACWSMVHGVTTLAAVHVNRAACLSHRWPPEFLLNSEESVEQVFDLMIQVLISGVLATARKN